MPIDMTQFVRSEIRFMIDPLLMKMRQELFGSGISFGTIAPAALPPTIIYTTNITQVIDNAGYIKGIKTYSGGTLVGTDQKELSFLGAGVATTGVRTTVDIATPLSTKMANPMTAAGDIIYGSTGGAPTRLGIGAEDYVLTVSGGLPQWRQSVAVSGFTNPMTTQGDIIYAQAGGAAYRLGIGASGQVLTSTGATPVWATPSGTAGSGMVNPMTTLGDLIIGISGGVPSRLGIGNNGFILTVVSGSPAWASASGTSHFGPFISYRLPTGAINGSNTTFTLPSLAIPDSVTAFIQLPGEYYMHVLPGSGVVESSAYVRRNGGLSATTTGGNLVNGFGSSGSSSSWTDNNTSTGCGFDQYTNLSVEYDLGAQYRILRASYVGMTTGGWSPPRSHRWDYSDDGTNWTSGANFTSSSSTEGSLTQDDLADNGLHRYWRLWVTDNFVNSGGFFTAMREIYLYDRPDSTDSITITPAPSTGSIIYTSYQRYV